MDSIFVMGEEDRSAFFQHMIQSFGATYVCLWSFYLPQPTNCLFFLDGIYQEISNQVPSSSSGSYGRRLFNVYCESINYVDIGRIPGFAFKNNLPYMELKLQDFQRLASSEVQLQFYREAGIKTVVFMGCASGEIEIGMSNEPQVDLEMEMKKTFPVDFSRQVTALPSQAAADQSRPSSSSSSLRSLSFDSPEYSPLMFNIPTTSLIQEPPKESRIETAVKSVPVSSTSPLQQTIEALSQIRNVQLPTIESEDAAMTKAILAVLSSSSAATSSSQAQNTLNFPSITPRSTAFQNYRMPLANTVATRNRKQNMFKRSVLFFRNLNLRRRQDFQIHGNRPTTTQLHHMISERKRREKLNESFQLLRSLLPSGSKKDKASVLSSTTEYLSSLRSQVSELSKRNQILESQLSNQREAYEEVEGSASSSSQERLNIQINHVSTSSSSSEARMLDLRITVRGECSMLDLVIRTLELLKKQRNLSLISVESNTRMVESATSSSSSSSSVHSVLFRLKVEGDEFDESCFQEEVRKVVEELLR